MGKEVKIGLAVIAVLLSVFAVVLYTRLRTGEPEAIAAAKEPKTKKNDDEPKGKNKNHKRLSSGPSPAKIAEKRRSDRFASASDRRHPAEPATIAGDGRYDVAGGDDAVARDGDGQEDGSDAPFSSSRNRFGSRDRVRYGKADESPADDGVDTAGAAGLDDSTAMTDDGGTDDAERGPGDDATSDDATSDSPANRDTEGTLEDSEETLEGESDSNRTNRAAGNVLGDDSGPGASASMSDADELASSGPPSELEPADVEAPLSPDDEGTDESVVEPVGGSRFSRPTSDGSDEGPFSTASRRETAPMENGDDGIESEEDDTSVVEGGTYSVRPNDNYWIISQRVYGTGSYFKALQEFNRDRHPNPDRLDVGDEVSVPDVAMLEQTYPKLCPKRRHVAAQRRISTLASSRSGEVTGEKRYTVAEGDTLFDIARRELGSAERWSEIHDLNRDQLGDDIHYLSPGTRLALPSDDQPGGGPRERVTTRRGRGASRR